MEGDDTLAELDVRRGGVGMEEEEWEEEELEEEEEETEDEEEGEEGGVEIELPMGLFWLCKKKSS